MPSASGSGSSRLPSLGLALAELASCGDGGDFRIVEGSRVQGELIESSDETIAKISTVKDATHFDLGGKRDLIARYYDQLKKAKKKNGEHLSVDYQRNTLAEARTFLKWCARKKRWIASNPLDGVEGIGRRKHGKPQLRIDEARKWIAKAFELAELGEEGAVAALMALLLGLRASEIVKSVVRDLDDGGKLLWIPDAKTAKGRRTVQVPEELRGHLLELAEGKEPTEFLFGMHWRDWPREWVGFTRRWPWMLV